MPDENKPQTIQYMSRVWKHGCFARHNKSPPLLLKASSQLRGQAHWTPPCKAGLRVEECNLRYMISVAHNQSSCRTTLPAKAFWASCVVWLVHSQYHCSSSLQAPSSLEPCSSRQPAAACNVSVSLRRIAANIGQATCQASPSSQETLYHAFQLRHLRVQGQLHCICPASSLSCCNGLSICMYRNQQNYTQISHTPRLRNRSRDVAVAKPPPVPSGMTDVCSLQRSEGRVFHAPTPALGEQSSSRAKQYIPSSSQL